MTRLEFGNPEHIALRKRLEAEERKKERLALCQDCDSDGHTDCENCGGTGEVTAPCEECGGDGRAECEHPDVKDDEPPEYGL